ncbi:MAG: Fur family transcriptional regulator [Spirochaetota bacterium]
MAETVYRKSRQREHIFEYLKSTDSHPTAQMVFDGIRDEFPNLSLGTVYRNLNILVEQGKIKRLQHGSTFDRYDADIHEHYHFICRKCNRVYDLALNPKEDLEQIAQTESGHLVDEHKIDFFGICKECRRNVSAYGEA